MLRMLSMNTEIEDVINQFRSFSKDVEECNIFARNRTIRTSNIEIYLRKQLSFDKDTDQQNYHLCIASVNIHPQKEGIFSTILTAFEEEIGHFRYIEIECILNTFLENHLRKRGYVYSPQSNDYSISLQNTAKP